MDNQTTITIFTHNKPGVLYKIANLFLRRKINIESLTVSEIKTQNLSRFTIVVKKDPVVIDKIVKQLKRIIEVYDVYAHNDDALIFKEIALLKITVKNADQRKQIEDLTYQFQASVIHSEKNNVIIQKTGSEEDIDFLQSVLKPFGIKEVVKSGRVALEKKGADRLSDTEIPETLKRASRTASGIQISIIKRIELMTRDYKDVISLAQGVPSFYTPRHISQAAKEAIDNHKVDTYTWGQGIDELRIEIAKKLSICNKINTTPSEIIVTHGGIEALMSIFMALLNVEDEIIVLTPDYASHLTQITIATHGGKPVNVGLLETNKGWELDSARLEQAITTHTKAILICNPSNPTGKVFTKEELLEIAGISKKHNLYIITDEMYEDFLYDGRTHTSIGSFKDVADRVISVFGVSKSYSMTGWRIGYIATSQILIDQIMKIHDSIVTCPTAVSQYAALAAIKGPKTEVKKFLEAYTKRRAIVMEELAKTSLLEYTLPQGAYYCFPKITKRIDDIQLAQNLVKKAGVAVVPGSPFGAGGENHIRISFACEEDRLREGLKRLVNYLNKKI